jgi:hypothetical protein
MWSHQYDQMSNQVQCARLERSHFTTNNGEAHLFGLEPHFGCCTANFGQGWPKLALSGILGEGLGLAVGAIVPCVLDTAVEGVPVRCELETGYPFEDGYRVTVTAERPVTFSLSLRFPASARNMRINGEAVSAARRVIQKTWKGKTEIRAEMDFAAETVPFSSGRPDVPLFFCRRGNLVFALPVKARREKREYTRDGVERKFPYCDYELYGESPWNFAFKGGGLRFARRGLEGPAFARDTENAPVSIRTLGVPVDWPLINGAASPFPASLEPLGAEEEIELVPYGRTDLRMTLLPLLDMFSNPVGY